MIQANEAYGDLGSCVRRSRALYESSGAASAVVLGPRTPIEGHGHLTVSRLDRRCLVVVNIGATSTQGVAIAGATPAGPLTMDRVAPAAPALTVWPRKDRMSCMERPRRRRAREKVLDMYVRSGLLAGERAQARQTKLGVTSRAKIAPERHSLGFK